MGAMALQAAYTILILPLHGSREALAFYLWLRRMKELEQERDTLLDGIQLVERAQEWYTDKLHQAEQQRERVFSKDPPLVPPPPLLGSSLLIQVQEVNRFLSDLVSPSEKGGRRNGPCPIRAPDNLTTLQHHNNLLTRELSAQNQKIWKLQRENEALHRELQSATYTELPSSKSTAERHLHRATFI